MWKKCGASASSIIMDIGMEGLKRRVVGWLDGLDGLVG